MHQPPKIQNYRAGPSVGGRSLWTGTILRCPDSLAGLPLGRSPRAAAAKLRLRRAAAEDEGHMVADLSDPRAAALMDQILFIHNSMIPYGATPTK